MDLGNICKHIFENARLYCKLIVCVITVYQNCVLFVIFVVVIIIILFIFIYVLT
jgi:hypothetical protein